MSAIFEFSKNPKWPTYGLFFVTSLTNWASSASSFWYHVLDCFDIWESESMDTRDDARHFEFFSEFKMVRLLTHFSAAWSTIKGCLTLYSRYHLLNCSDIWEFGKRYRAWWTPFQNYLKIQNGWCDSCWVINKVNIVISLKAWYSVRCLMFWKENLYAICCDDIGYLNAFYLVEVEC